MTSPVIGCVKMLENRRFEHVGCALGQGRFENAGHPGAVRVSLEASVRFQQVRCPQG